MNVKYCKMTACVLMVVLMFSLVQNATLTAFAAEPTPTDGIKGEVYVGGVKVTTDNSGDVFGDGTVSYNPDTNTLTLNNANITGKNPSDFISDSEPYPVNERAYGISYSNYDITDNYTYTTPFTLAVKGDNVVKAHSSTSLSMIGIGVAGVDLKLTGSGNLTVDAILDDESTHSDCMGIQTTVEDSGITVDMTGTLTINSISRFHTYNAAIHSAGNIVIEKGTINAYSNSKSNGDGTVNQTAGTSDLGAAIYAEFNNKKITINGGTINAYSGKANTVSCGIGGANGTKITINGGTVNASAGQISSGDSYGIGTSDYYEEKGIVTITGGTVNAKGGISGDAGSYGIGAVGGVVISDNANVTAIGSDGAESYGIGTNGDITISGNSVVTATSGKAENLSYGIGASGAMTISGKSKVTATAGIVTNPASPLNYSFGLASLGTMSLSTTNTLSLDGDRRALASAQQIVLNEVSGVKFRLTSGDGSKIDDISSYTGKKLDLVQLYTVVFNGENVTSDGAEEVVVGNDYVATLTASENYAINENEIVIKTNGNVISDYTFDSATGKLTVPASEIEDTLTISVKAEKITYPVTFVGSNIDFSGKSIAEKGSDYVVTLTADENYYIVLDKLSVTVAGNAISDYNFDSDTGVLTIPKANVNGNIKISAESALKVYKVTFESLNATSNGDTQVVVGNNYTATLKADENYIFTDAIVVKVGQNEIVNYTYNFDGDTATITIPASEITDDIVIIVEAQIKRYLVTYIDYDNQVIKADYVSHGANAIAPPNPARTGFKFIGWDKDGKNITSETVIKAMYEEITEPTTEPETEPTTEPTTVQDTTPQIEGEYAEKTGDNANILLLFVLLFVGCSTFFVLKLSERKKKIRF